MDQLNDQITTKDGSITFRSRKYDETYHSLSGAKEEAIRKFIEPCRIRELAETNRQVHILDICFGLGYNSAAAIDAANRSGSSVEIIGLENDIEIMKKIKGIDADFESYGLVKELAESESLGINRDNIRIKVILGDARISIKELPDDHFDAVFLDPFSPKKCPELWTGEFFRDIKKTMKKNSIMATYSCARIVRDNFRSAGFDVKDGPCVGRRAPGTIAIKQ